MTPAQSATLKTYIEATYPAQVAAPSGNNAAFIAESLSAPTADFYVWNNQYPVNVIFDAITWANLTPTDVADGTQLWMNRSLSCQGKQFNVQTILTGREYINFSKTNVRAGLQDALTNVPSGAGGAAVAAGWVPVRDGGKKLATGLEKALATGEGSFANPAVTGDLQTIGWNEIFSLMGW